jgi:NAD(P)-dependent dehydrogenase (short-subunit alcohol dehydrogenase family)
MKALVTGASRGIGRAIAQALLQAGYEVTGTSRNPSALSDAERLPGLRWLPLDLRSGESIGACAAAAGNVDVLVNNAGVSQVGALEELPLERVRSLFEMNVFGTVRLTQLILPGMRERRSGAIVTVTSFAAVTTIPFFSAYAGSKAALVAVFRGLRQEVAPWGIRVCVLAPFEMRTTMPLDVCYDQASSYMPFVGRVHAMRDRQLAGGPDPSMVADAMLRILRSRRPRFSNFAGRNARVTAFLVRHLPERIAEAGVRSRSGLSATRARRR